MVSKVVFKDIEEMVKKASKPKSWLYGLGHIPWNKYLTAETDKRIRKCRDMKTGVPRSETTKEKIRNTLRKGIFISCKYCKKKVYVSPSDKQRKYCSIRCMGLGYRNRKLSKRHKKILSESKIGSKNPMWKVGKKHPLYGKKGKDNPRYGKKHLVKTKRMIANSVEISWMDPIKAAKRIRNIIKAVCKKPNRSEKFLQIFLNKILPNEYRYVGNGQLVVGRKCPDFMNINGKKKLIELYGRYWHKGQDPQDRIDLFKKYRYDTLVIWEEELKNCLSLKEKVLQFNLMENLI